MSLQYTEGLGSILGWEACVSNFFSNRTVQSHSFQFSVLLLQKSDIDQAAISSSTSSDNRFDTIVVTEADSAQSEDIVTEGGSLLSHFAERGSAEPSEKTEDR